LPPPQNLVTRLADALSPLESLGNKPCRLSDLAARHRLVLAALSKNEAEEVAFIGADGARLADALDELAASEAAAALLVEPSDYVELFSAALAGRVIRRPAETGLRVRILGLLEARLTESDRVVLGGLVEGTWPPESNNDAWLSRRCGSTSGSICRNAASVLPPMTSRNCSEHAR